jgi:hypothetical protein
MVCKKSELNRCIQIFSLCLLSAGESDAGNQLMACEFCNLWWHQHCEGVTTVPPGAYYCKVCSRGTSFVFGA